MRILIFLIITLGFISCDKSIENGKTDQKNIKVKIPGFNQDSAFHFIAQQVSFGERYMNTQAHESCKNWLIEKLKLYQLEVIEQKFDAKLYNGVLAHGTNIIGRFNSDIKERILLCAHYDSRHIAEKDAHEPLKPIKGADDGGSGVGVILEIARQINAHPIPMGVDIVFFDAEDSGSNERGMDYTWGLGSQFWSKNIHEENYQVKYGILLDMVGSTNATFPKEGYSMETAGSEVNKIWKFAKSMGYGKYFVGRKAAKYTDDHRFIVENTTIPMIDVINIKADGKFGAYHHTHDDNMEVISKETLKAVGQIILATVYKESNKEKF